MPNPAVDKKDAMMHAATVEYDHDKRMYVAETKADEGVFLQGVGKTQEVALAELRKSVDSFDEPEVGEQEADSMEDLEAEEEDAE